MLEWALVTPGVVRAHRWSRAVAGDGGGPAAEAVGVPWKVCRSRVICTSAAAPAFSDIIGASDQSGRCGPASGLRGRSQNRISS